MIVVEELGHAGGTHATLAIKPQPAVSVREDTQTVEHRRVNLELVGEVGDRCRMMQRVRHSGLAQRDEHAVVEHSEQALHDA